MHSIQKFVIFAFIRVNKSIKYILQDHGQGMFFEDSASPWRSHKGSEHHWKPQGTCYIDWSFVLPASLSIIYTHMNHADHLVMVIYNAHQQQRYAQRQCIKPLVSGQMYAVECFHWSKPGYTQFARQFRHLQAY